MDYENNPPQWDSDWLKTKYPQRFAPFPYVMQINIKSTTFIEVDVDFVIKKVREVVDKETGKIVSIFDTKPHIYKKKCGRKYTIDEGNPLECGKLFKTFTAMRRQ